MKRKMETSELIFKIVAYVFIIVFALMCVYPFIYALSCSFSSAANVQEGKVVLWPLAPHGLAYKYVLTDNRFWVSYANTLFMAAVGTIWCMIYTLMGAYALSKKRLLGRHGWNFFLVFTMWFSAGIVPQYLNYSTTGEILAKLGGGEYADMDQKWLIILAMERDKRHPLEKLLRRRSRRDRRSGEDRRRDRNADTYQSIHSHEQGDDRDGCIVLRYIPLERLFLGDAYDAQPEVQLARTGLYKKLHRSVFRLGKRTR